MQCPPASSPKVIGEAKQIFGEPTKYFKEPMIATFFPKEAPIISFQQDRLPTPDFTGAINLSAIGIFNWLTL